MGGGSRIFNVKQHIFHEDGLLTIKVSAWEDGETHWTGFLTVAPSEPDYDFWYWMTQVGQVTELVQESELSKWKAIYKTRTGWAELETVQFDPLLEQPRKKAPVNWPGRLCLYLVGFFALDCVFRDVLADFHFVVAAVAVAGAGGFRAAGNVVRFCLLVVHWCAS